jgi:hypothetical protein
MDKKIKKLHNDEPSLTFEEIMEILEAELFEIRSNNDNPYKPLNFHDDNESYEE